MIFSRSGKMSQMQIMLDSMQITNKQQRQLLVTIPLCILGENQAKREYVGVKEQGLHENLI